MVHALKNREITSKKMWKVIALKNFEHENLKWVCLKKWVKIAIDCWVLRFTRNVGSKDRNRAHLASFWIGTVPRDQGTSNQRSYGTKRMKDRLSLKHLGRIPTKYMSWVFLYSFSELNIKINRNMRIYMRNIGIFRLYIVEFENLPRSTWTK